MSPSGLMWRSKLSIGGHLGRMAGARWLLSSSSVSSLMTPSPLHFPEGEPSHRPDLAAVPSRVCLCCLSSTGAGATAFWRPQWGLRDEGPDRTWLFFCVTSLGRNFCRLMNFIMKSVPEHSYKSQRSLSIIIFKYVSGQAKENLLCEL